MRIDNKYKWLARDEDGKLLAYEDKPYKGGVFWDVIGSDGEYNDIEEKDDTYSFIKWNDEKPFAINEKVVCAEIEHTTTQSDVVNKPSHYIGINGLEMEEVLENFLPRFEDGYVSHRVGSATEYLLRSPLKNGIEDIKKAKRNLEQVIAYEEGKVKPEEVVDEPEQVIQPTDDHLNEFLACLRGIKVMEDKNMEKVSTFYHGYNLND